MPNLVTDPSITTSRHVDTAIIRAKVLKETGNTLTIEAVNREGRTRSEGAGGNLDDFVVDNFVIFYKTMSAIQKIWWL